MTLTNADMHQLIARDIKRREDEESYYDALSADYDEMSPEQGWAEARRRDPLLFGSTAGLWQDERDADREARRDDDLRPPASDFRWSA